MEGDAVVSGVTATEFESGTPFVALVDGTRNGGVHGGVSEFTSSVSESESMPLTRSLFALRLRSAEVQPADHDLLARIFSQDGLQAGERSHSVNNFVAEDGQSVRPCNAGTASVTIRFVPIIDRPFIRGDSNGDGRVDISDAIYTLQFLFAGGPEPPCLDAAAVRDCPGLDLGDGIVTLIFLFQGGSMRAPGAFACGDDPTFDNLGCQEYPHCP